ncbi:hypothetical protein [Xanthomonas cannabis]|uniref:hypothetical protein n=1 Tax=Xanthomonas cannabis TaxID=1885674 RepID=UPI0033B2FC7F
MSDNAGIIGMAASTSNGAHGAAPAVTGLYTVPLSPAAQPALYAWQAAARQNSTLRRQLQQVY